MIRKKQPEVTIALCDACGKPLVTNEYGVHYGDLKSRFGYGSDLDHPDTIPCSFDLCEGCWTRALRAIDLPVTHKDQIYWEPGEHGGWTRAKDPKARIEMLKGLYKPEYQETFVRESLARLEEDQKRKKGTL